MLNYTSPSLRKASVALPFAVASCMAGLPAQAATLAESIGSFSFENFSATPLGTDANSDESFFSDGTGANASAIASATFDSLTEAATANGSVASSAATGDMSGTAFAKSDATLFGDFAVKAGDTFSFDFSGFADLLTSVDQPADSASAFFETQYSIFRADLNEDNGTVVDSFSIVGSINDANGQDSLNITNSDAITLSAFDTSEVTGDSLLDELISFNASGRYERTFEQDSIVSLVAFKVSVAETVASGVGGNQPQKVPDSSSALLGLIGVGAAALMKRNSREKRAA